MTQPEYIPVTVNFPDGPQELAFVEVTPGGPLAQVYYPATPIPTNGLEVTVVDKATGDMVTSGKVEAYGSFRNLAITNPAKFTNVGGVTTIKVTSPGHKTIEEETSIEPLGLTQWTAEMEYPDDWSGAVESDFPGTWPLQNTTSKTPVDWGFSTATDSKFILSGVGSGQFQGQSVYFTLYKPDGDYLIRIQFSNSMNLSFEGGGTGLSEAVNSYPAWMVWYGSDLMFHVAGTYDGINAATTIADTSVMDIPASDRWGKMEIVVEGATLQGVNHI